MSKTPAEMVAQLLPCKMADPLLAAEGLCRLIETPPVRPEAREAVVRLLAGVLGTTPSLAYAVAWNWFARVRPLVHPEPLSVVRECVD